MASLGLIQPEDYFLEKAKKTNGFPLIHQSSISVERATNSLPNSMETNQANHKKRKHRSQGLTMTIFTDPNIGFWLH